MSRARRTSCLVLALACLASGPLLAVPAHAEPPGSWWYDALKVEQAHARADGDGVTVAIVDGPLHPDAPELRGQDVTAVSACEGLAAQERTTRAAHGTAMAAYVAGNGRGPLPDGSGIAGVAPGATVRVYAMNDSEDGFRCDGGPSEESDDTDVDRAVRAAIADGVDIINLSFTSSSGRTAVGEALAAGIVVVAASGANREDDTFVGATSFPAGLPGVVSVNAVAQDGSLWDRAPRGTVLVAAPGSGVTSGEVRGDGSWSSDAVGSGSSPSSAIVSGMLAVVKSAHPGATGPQLVQHLLRNTTTDGLQWNDQYGFGIASLTRMLAADPTVHPDFFPFTDATVDTYQVVQGPDAVRAALDQPSPPPAAPTTAAPNAGPSGAPAAGDAAGPADRDGVPVGALVAGAVAAPLLALGAVVALRRRRSSLAPPVTEGR